MYRHNNTARQSSVFFIWRTIQIRETERAGDPQEILRVHRLCVCASGLSTTVILKSFAAIQFPACILDSRGDNSATVYLPGFCCVFYHRRRGIISTFQFPLAYLLQIEILYPITRDLTSFKEMQNLHIIDVIILNHRR